MKKTYWISLLVVAVAVLAVVVVKQHQQTKMLKQQLASPVAERTGTPKSSQPRPEPTAAVPKQEPHPAASAPMSSPAAEPSDDSKDNNFMAGIAKMMKDPQMKEMMRLQQKRAIDKMYGAFFRQLGWSESDVDKFKELLLDRQMALAEAGMAIMSGSSEDRQKATEMIPALKKEQDKKIETFLGPQAYEVFQSYEQTLGERMALQMFRETLSADAVLTDQQETALMTAMLEERKALPASSLLNNREPDPSRLTDEQIAETLQQIDQLQQRYTERAATILSPAQLEEFKKWQQQWIAMQAMGLKMAGQMFRNRAPQPPSP